MGFNLVFRGVATTNRCSVAFGRLFGLCTIAHDIKRDVYGVDEPLLSKTVFLAELHLLHTALASLRMWAASLTWVPEHYITP